VTCEQGSSFIVWEKGLLVERGYHKVHKVLLEKGLENLAGKREHSQDSMEARGPGQVHPTSPKSSLSEHVLWNISLTVIHKKI
jgi:hypothetical protein